MPTKTLLVLALVALVNWTLRAEETEVLFDGTGLTGWDTARDPERLARELAKSELTVAESPSALRWRFASKSIPFNDLFLRTPIDRAYRQIRLLVRNPGPCEADFPDRSTRVFLLER